MICQISNATCYIANLYMFAGDMCFSTNQPSSFGLLVARGTFLLINFVFPHLGKTLLPKGVYRPWDHFSCSVNICKCIVNHKSNLGLGDVFHSCIFVMGRVWVLLWHSFSHNTHNRKPIVRLWGRGMGLLLWVQIGHMLQPSHVHTALDLTGLYREITVPTLTAG